MNQKTLVLFHGNCKDGFCAAWVAHRALKGEVEAIPCWYGTPPPDVTGRNVLVLDFSYPRDVLLEMKAKATGIIVLDHHKSAMADLEGLKFCTFDLSKSGARLTWEFFHGNTPAPWLVDYTEDRDLWRFKLPDSSAVNAALRSYETTFDVWNFLETKGPEQLVPEGQAILRYQHQIIEEHKANAVEVEWNGHKVLQCNASTLFSEIAGELAAGRAFGACYFNRSDGMRQWSLRSDECGVDVSLLAKERGGGGHFHAAGFEEKI